MILEAEQHAESDRERRELIEAANAADTTAHDTEKNLHEFKDQLDPKEVEIFQGKINELREIVAKSQTDGIKAEEIRQKTSAFQLDALKLFEIAYKKVQSVNAASRVYLNFG